MFEKLALQLLEWAATPWGSLVLIIHSYLESFILPLPHDPILMTVALADPKYSFVFAAMSSLDSALGLTTGYTIGRLTRKTPLACKIRANKHFAEVEGIIQRYHRWATFIACFTPIPDKLYCAVAGIMKLDFTNFILIGLLARACRFFMVGALIFFFGEVLRDWILHSMKWFLLGFVALGVVLYFATKMFYCFLDKKLHLSPSEKKCA
ncbi:MAG TPA: hypothetical protein DIS66_07235 [Candidatus Omnitrophica bacterium]|nr:hypothetical protein [Candidatus Omnitrophota bacterium]